MKCSRCGPSTVKETLQVHNSWTYILDTHDVRLYDYWERLCGFREISMSINISLDVFVTYIDMTFYVVF